MKPHVSGQAGSLLSLFLFTLLFCGQVFSEITIPAGAWRISHAVRRSDSPRRQTATVAPAPNTRLLISGIDELVSPYLKSSSFSGEILVARKGKVLVNKGYGLANREHSTAVTSQTRFYIASISKSFTAAAILLLQERGKLRVTDPVSRFISDFPNGEQITIHHLLTHTSGIPDYVRFPDFTEISQKAYSTKDAVELFRNKPLTFKPGERSSYSNSNYVLLAHIIEKLSGLSFEEFLRANFFQPLGLKNTGQEKAPEGSIPRMATGYVPVELHGFERARYFDHSISTGAGSLYSTPEDLAAWIQGLFAGRVLTIGSVEQMYQVHSDGTAGYSWTLRKLWDRDVIIENGWDGVGFAGTLMYVPKDEVTIVVLGNLNISSVTGEIANNVTALALGEQTSPLTVARERVTPALKEKLVGRYKLGDDFFVPGTVLEIVERDGELYEQQRNPDRLVGLIRLSELEFMHRSSWGRIRFEINEKNDVTGLLFFGRFKAIKLPNQ